MTTRILLVALSLALAACGGDDDDSSAHHDAAVADSGAEHHDAGAADSGAFSNVACNPSGSGACQNEADCPIIVTGSARMAAESCGLGCIANDDKAGCSRTCVVNQTQLSDACASCYVDIVLCSFDHCVTECAVDAESQACFDCQVSNGCRAAFDTCSGLPPAKRPDAQ